MNIKYIFTALFLILTAGTFGQSASDYFPGQLNYRWYFEVTPLDSVGDPVSQLSYIRKDTFIGEGTYYGRNAKLILSEADIPGPTGSSFLLDSTYVSFDGQTASIFLSLVSAVDTTVISDSSFISWLMDFTDWYSFYKFDSPSDLVYQLFERDTVVNLNGNALPIRIRLEAKRESDETISTILGQLACKKFTFTPSISVLIGIPPIIFPVKILEVPDTVWIAEDRWIVKEYRPTQSVDLSLFQLPEFYVPGASYVLVDEPVSVVRISAPPDNISLEQNYPNPFNPETSIEFSIPQTSFVTLKVYDLLGREIETLVEKMLESGYHKLNFSGEELASGIYLYILKADNYTITKKMILQK